jgi:clostripain
VRSSGTSGFTLNYGRDRADGPPFFDLFDFATRIAGSERFDAPTRAAAGKVAAATDELVVASFGGSSLQRFVSGSTGVWITFPDGDASVRQRDGERKLWAMCRWYSPLPVDGVYGRLAFCRDGAKAGNGVVENWFELLDAWFEAGAENGGANCYAH